jgi:hypothetical protein
MQEVFVEQNEANYHFTPICLSVRGCLGVTVYLGNRSTDFSEILEFLEKNK